MDLLLLCLMSWFLSTVQRVWLWVWHRVPAFGPAVQRHQCQAYWGTTDTVESKRRGLHLLEFNAHHSYLTVKHILFFIWGFLLFRWHTGEIWPLRSQLSKVILWSLQQTAHGLNKLLQVISVLARIMSLENVSSTFYPRFRRCCVLSLFSDSLICVHIYVMGLDRCFRGNFHAVSLSPWLFCPGITLSLEGSPVTQCQIGLEWKNNTKKCF